MLKKVNQMKEEAAEVFKAGKFQEAIDRFRECLEVDEFNSNMNATICLNMALCHLKLDQPQKDEAMRLLNRAIKFNPKYAKAYIKRGDLYLQMEEYNEAINSYHTASEYDSSGFNVQAKL